MAEYTKGKWELDYSNGAGWNNTKIAEIAAARISIIVPRREDIDAEEMEANARLIAAAPAMYEALKAVAFLEKTNMTKDQMRTAIHNAKAAIAQAERKNQ